MTRHKKEPLPTNPHILRWARTHAGFSEEEAAGHMKVPRTKLVEWETPNEEGRPTVRQARKLADYYGRSFLEFFLPVPPPVVEPELIPDFRLYPRAPDPSEQRALKDIQLWGEAQRTNALDLYEELGENPRPSEIVFSLKDDPEKASAYAREAISLTLEEQLDLKQQQREQFPALLRGKIEQLDILTFKVSALKRYGVRGFCIAEQKLPIIMFGKESPNAQAFTLCHELAHVLIRQSAISGPIPQRGGDSKKREVEEWCDSFAAAFLMPTSTVQACAANFAFPDKTASDETLLAMSEYFAVSRHAMCIRLMHLGFVSENFYWEVKKPQFDEEEARYRSFGRPKYYGRRFIGSQGDLYTSLVVDALNAGRITNHNAAEFMGTTLTHIGDILGNFRK